MEEDIIKVGNLLSGTFSLFSVLNFIIFQKKKDTLNRFIFFLQFFLMIFHLSFLALDESQLNIPASVAIFGYLLSSYSLLFAIIFICLIYTSIIQYIFDSSAQLRSQKRIEKAFLLTVCISMLFALYPIFEQQADTKEYILQKTPKSLALLVIIPSILFFSCIISMIRARSKRLTYNKEMRSLLINNNMLTEPKIILVFTLFNICQLLYSFIDEQYDIEIANQLQIPYSFMGFITSIHYILFSGLYKSTFIDKIKKIFAEDGFNDEQSLVGDPHAESIHNDYEKK